MWLCQGTQGAGASSAARVCVAPISQARRLGLSYAQHLLLHWEWTGTAICQTQHGLSECSVPSDRSRNTHLATNTLGFALCPLTCVAAQDHPHTAAWLLRCQPSPLTSLLPGSAGYQQSRECEHSAGRAFPCSRSWGQSRTLLCYQKAQGESRENTAGWLELPRLFRRWRQKQEAGEGEEIHAAQGTGVVLAVNNGVTKSSLQR